MFNADERAKEIKDFCIPKCKKCDIYDIDMGEDGLCFWCHHMERLRKKEPKKKGLELYMNESK